MASLECSRLSLRATTGLKNIIYEKNKAIDQQKATEWKEQLITASLRENIIASICYTELLKFEIEVLTKFSENKCLSLRCVDVDE